VKLAEPRDRLEVKNHKKMYLEYQNEAFDFKNIKSFDSTNLIIHSPKGLLGKPDQFLMNAII